MEVRLMLRGDTLYTSSKVRAMIWGRVGSGKTCSWGLAMQQPEIANCYAFDFDERLQSLTMVLTRDVLEAKLNYDTFRDGQVAGVAYNKARAKLDALLSLAPEDLPNLVAVDTLTTLGVSVMNSVLQMDGMATNAVPNQQQYLKAIKLINPFVQDLCSLRTNIALTVHEETYADKVTEQVYKDIYVYPSLRNILPGYFDELWHCEAIGGEFKIRTISNGIYAARTCIQGLQPLEKAEVIWEKAMQRAAPAPAQTAQAV